MLTFNVHRPRRGFATWEIVAFVVWATLACTCVAGATSVDTHARPGWAMRWIDARTALVRR